MILEKCSITEKTNQFWKEKILDFIPELSAVSDGKFLSLKEYIIDTPQKFYNKQTFHDYLKFLNNCMIEHPNWLVNMLKKFLNDLNIGIKTLNNINQKHIHDIVVPNNNIEIIQYIENHIHFNYLQLTEAIYHKFILLIAYENRLKRNKLTEKLDIYNCIVEIKKTKFIYTSKNYNNIIRNGIAHGRITYKNGNTIYTGKKGKSFEIETNKIIRMFDNLLDVSNGFALALKIFIIKNRTFFSNNNLLIPRQFLIQELKAQSNAPRWKVVGCLESITINNRKQLNIFTENSLLALEEINYYALRTAVFAEYFANGYDRYFFSLKSKYSLNGWAGYDGVILKRERENNSNNYEDYKGVLEENLIFFKPKIYVPKFVRKIINLLIIIKNNFRIDFSDLFNKQYNFELRNTNPFRRKLSIIINNSNLYISAENSKHIVKIIKNKYKQIIKYTIKKSKKELKTRLSKFLPIKYIQVTIYDTNARKRKLRGSGLIESLICSITLNKSKEIKNIDFINGKLELKGKYRIVWNNNWKGIKYI